MESDPQFPILTRELALRIEAVIAPDTAESPENGNSIAPIIARFGRTIASKARAGRPANKVFCFGHEDLDHLDEILTFYAVDDLEPGFYLAPMGFTPQVAAALSAAGFVPRSYQQTILYGLPQTAPPQLPSGVTIERVTAANLDAFVQTTAAGFAWLEQWRDAAMADLRRDFNPEAIHFLARFQGEPAGVASLDIRGQMASLIDGAVIPQCRRQGIHLAMLQQRQHIAHTFGCHFVVGGTVFGSASFRNQQRAGLRLAYIESSWVRKGKS